MLQYLHYLSRPRYEVERNSHSGLLLPRTLRLLNIQGQQKKNEKKKKDIPASQPLTYQPKRSRPQWRKNSTHPRRLPTCGFRLHAVQTWHCTRHGPASDNFWNLCGPGPQKYSIQERSINITFECTERLERQGSVSIISMYKLVWNSHPVFSVPKLQAQALHSALQ